MTGAGAGLDCILSTLLNEAAYTWASGIFCIELGWYSDCLPRDGALGIILVGVHERAEEHFHIAIVYFN
jgi:hypothetical protein